MTAISATDPLTSSARPGRPKFLVVRRLTEGGVMTSLILCGAFSLLTTAAIIYTLSHEAWRFFTGFEDVSLREFLLGLRWSPLLGGEKHFGVWPLVCGTVMVTAVAMLFAGPLGLITAIWLSEYAHPRIRAALKPVLEILAGVPTVVLGFFALTVITPTLQFAFIKQPTLGPDGRPLVDAQGNVITQAWNPLGIEGYNVLAAGIAVGILTLPIVTSLTEDALRAVPRSLREGSQGLGATRFETSLKVVFPAALSGIIAAMLLAIARCVGETMVVALAAGGAHVPLYQITDPPLQLHEWHAAGQRGSTTPIVALSPGQSHDTAAFKVGEDETITEIELFLTPDSTATAVRIEVMDAAGRRIAEGRADVPGASSDTSVYLSWRVPAEDAPSDSADASELHAEHGRFLTAGAYRARITALDGPAGVSFMAVKGERHMPLASRLAMPFDVRRSMQPMTGYLVQIFLGDVSNLGVEYYSSYAVAALLFVMTFVLTIVGHIIRVRFQQSYE